MRTGTLVAVSLLAAPTSQAVGRQASPPTFQAGTQVVLLDLVAKDGEDRPVADLGIGDLQVFENGQAETPPPAGPQAASAAARESEVAAPSYRDVFEMNGEPVRDREERLVELFSKPRPDVHEQARELLAASAAYNIGPVKRTVNLPTLPLVFLLAENQSRFEFGLGERKTIDATEAVELLFREKARPTLVKGPGGADLPVKGRFWLNPTRGTVLRSEVEFDFGPEARARVTADYRPEPALAMWVPSEMREEYADLGGAKMRTFPNPFKSVARYGKFRQFTVHSEEGEAKVVP